MYSPVTDIGKVAVFYRKIVTKVTIYTAQVCTFKINIVNTDVASAVGIEQGIYNAYPNSILAVVS
jgi:hypothetical protein